MVCIHTPKYPNDLTEDLMHKVLVVDDSAFTRRMMRQHLEASGFDVVEAESGPEAIELYGQHQPDVVTLDLVMPDMEGEEVL